MSVVMNIIINQRWFATSLNVLKDDSSSLYTVLRLISVIYMGEISDRKSLPKLYFHKSVFMFVAGQASRLLLRLKEKCRKR